MENSQHDTAAAIIRLADWLEAHIELFRPLPDEGLNSFRHIKPLGESVLILYSFHAPGCETQHPRMQQWIASMTEDLFGVVEMWGVDIDWKNLLKAMQTTPEVSAPLLIFPVTEHLTGRPSGWMKHVRSCFNAPAPDNYLEQLDSLFARDLAEVDDCHEQAVLLLNRTIAGEEGFYTSTLYLVTHYIFFGTRMGHREMKLRPEQREELEKYLRVALRLTSAKQNYDLTAELLLCFHLMKFAPTGAYSDALKLLTGVVHKYGFVPGRHDGNIHDKNDALEHYHACLLTIAALGHAIEKH